MSLLKELLIIEDDGGGDGGGDGGDTSDPSPAYAMGPWGWWGGGRASYATGGSGRKKKKKKKGKRSSSGGMPTFGYGLLGYSGGFNDSGPIGESLGLATDESNFNAADVISKLDAAEKKAKNTEDTVTFGLEDEDGQIVKVYVRQDQAKEFESALGALLSGGDGNEDDQNTALEIAEVLFELKNKFDIIDVDWGTIPGDEEEEQEVAPGEEELPPEGAEGELPPEEMAPPDTGTDATSALQQVIDLLKAQADSQRAEAEARTAEAKAKEAEYTAIAAKTKIKQEEEVIDMEAYYKKKADEKKEAQRLAKLAKYKHDLAQEAGETLAGGAQPPAPAPEQQPPMGGGASLEQEEKVVNASRLAELIFGQIRGR